MHWRPPRDGIRKLTISRISSWKLCLVMGLSSQAMWLYVLFAFSIILSFVVLTLKYCQWCVTLLIRRVFPCTNDQWPHTSQMMTCQGAPRVPAADPVVANCPSSIEMPPHCRRRRTRPPLPQLRSPEKFQLWNWPPTYAVAGSDTDKRHQWDVDPQNRIVTVISERDEWWKKKRHTTKGQMDTGGYWCILPFVSWIHLLNLHIYFIVVFVRRSN
jgi:hypothetical protein